jgi:hypothetical protein
MMKGYFVTSAILCGLALAVAGCSSHYRVTDPASGKTYYTTKINDAGRAGAVKIKDDRTGSTVTLQSSEVKEISADEYEAGLKMAPSALK